MAGPPCRRSLTKFSLFPDAALRDSERGSGYSSICSCSFNLRTRSRMVRMATPVPRAPMVNLTRKVLSMAAMSVPLVVRMLRRNGKRPQDCLGGECTRNHRNAAYNVKGVARDSDGRRKQLHCDPDCHCSDEGRCLEAPTFSQGEARCSRPPQFRPCREYRTDETTPRLVIVYYENAGSLRYR
jgi:hypothetical protein